MDALSYEIGMWRHHPVLLPRVAENDCECKMAIEYDCPESFRRLCELRLVGRTLSTMTMATHDLLFGLLGLVFPEDGHRSLVDYNLKTRAEVYLKLARFCLERLKSPIILSLVGTEIPSRWMPVVLPVLPISAC